MRKLLLPLLPALCLLVAGSAINIIGADPDPGTGLPTPGDPGFEGGDPAYHQLAYGTWGCKQVAAEKIWEAFLDPLVHAAGLDGLIFSEAMPLYIRGLELEAEGKTAFDAGDSTTAHLKYLAAQLAFADAYAKAQEIMEMAWYYFGGGY